MCRADDGDEVRCSCFQPRNALPQIQADDAGQNCLDDGSGDEGQDAGGDAHGDGAVGDDHEHCNAHHIVDHRADDDSGDESTLESVTVLHAEADDVGHQGERDEEAAGGADELIETAGEVCQHRHAHGTQRQIDQRSDGRKLGTQHHSSQRDGEGLHGHGDAQRHRDGELGHDGDDGGEQTCIADVPHRELGLGGRSGLGGLTHNECSSYTCGPGGRCLAQSGHIPSMADCKRCVNF